MLQRTTQSNPATIISFFAVSEHGLDAYKCGNLHLGNFYRALATIYTLKYLAPIPFHLRGLVVDTCSNSLRIDRDLYGILSSGAICNADSKFDWIINNSTLGGVVTSSTNDVIAANRILAPLRIPTVGTFSTSKVLNDKFMFPYVARTISPDYQETNAIVDILKSNNWTRVSVIYTKEVYGRSSFSNLKTRAKQEGICIALSIALSSESTNSERNDALLQLATKDGANVIILIAISPDPILKSAKELNIIKRYLWIGTETWGTMQFDNEMMADLSGSLTVAMRNTQVTGFNEYVKKLTYEKRADVPDDWFEEFYQQIHQCQLPSAATVYRQYPLCNKSEEITDDKLKIDNHVIYTTIAAVYSIANGLQMAKNERCAGLTSFQECFKEVQNRDHMFKRLLETKWSGWTDEDGFDLNFNEDRYWDVGFDVYNMVKESGSSSYKKIGSTFGDTSQDFLSIQTYKPDHFTSSCPLTEDCVCEDDLIHPKTGAQNQGNLQGAKIAEPRNFYYYQSDFQYDKHYTWPIWAIAVCVPTCVGLFVGIFIFFFFLCTYPVRGGTTILGFMAIFGILCIYAINFAFFLHASSVTCVVRRLLMGIVYAIVFAALLIKSIDNWRFNKSEQNLRKYSGLTSSCSLFAISVGLVCVQVIIPVEWLIIIHPTASLLSDNRRHDWWYCDPVETHDYSLALSMSFVIFLVVLTAVFSGMSWDSNSNYYESRWICVSCISTAGCFLVWMVVTTNAGPSFRDPAVALGNFFNATALLVFLPIRKVILLHSVNKSNRPREKEEDNIYANMDNDIYSSIYQNGGYEDYYHPLERKQIMAEHGF